MTFHRWLSALCLAFAFAGACAEEPPGVGGSTDGSVAAADADFLEFADAQAPGGDAAVPPDARSGLDAARPDATAIPPDASRPDAAAPDGGPPDGGPVRPDAGPADGGWPDGSTPACTATAPRTVPIQVFVDPDASEAPYVDVLRTATSSIRMYAYLLGTGGVLDTLKNKAVAGVSVKVILDVSNQANSQTWFDQLVAAGAQAKWSNPAFTYTHAKSFVVDSATAVISTGNYSLYYINRERNFVVHDDDPADVASLASLFDADWSGAVADLSCTRLVVSPVNSRARILDVINSAQSTLVVESMQFADTEVRSAVAARKMAGVDVRVLLADPAWISANDAAATFLTARQIPVRYLTTPPLHAKAILADGDTAYLGSENLSYTSLSYNREVGVVATETVVLSTVSTTFEADWLLGTAF